jgi:two-component system, NtrC family, response regulator HydG
MEPKILIVDDDDAQRRMLQTVLGQEQYRVYEANDGAAAVAAVEEQFFDLILLDMRMPTMGGIEALKRIKHLSPGIPIILMTAYATVDTAVKALKSGAFDYLIKPLDIDEIKLLVKRALQHTQLEKENVYLKERLNDRFKLDNIIGQSQAMGELLETIAQIAPTDATVLITGESGTGKELIANTLHMNSSRADLPMIKVNCAALPDTLLESELFGHEKGAFTGAVKRKQGRFQLAHRSSIFLDEIGEMSLATQAKILRVLQEREFEPVGSGETISIDTRVITATNKDLASEIKADRFREDLFYRLNVINVEIPPLRHRRDDIPLLADFFLKRYVEKNRRLIKGFTPRAEDVLMRYHWPGNVRELENLVERAVVLSRGDRIGPEDFPESVLPKDDGGDRQVEVSKQPRSLKEAEKEMILLTLSETNGNRTHAAQILGISRRTLQLKLKAYGIN